MRKLTYAIALLPIVLALQGCALVRIVRFARGQKVLTVDANDLTFCGVRADGLHFDVALQLENLSDGEAHLREIRLEVLLDNEPVFSATRHERLSIPQKGKLAVHVPIVIDPLSIAAGAAGGARALVLRGTVMADIGLLGARRFSFTSSQKLFPGTRRRVRLEGVSFRKSSLREACLTLRMRQENGGDDPYRSVAIAGTVLVNGLRVGVIDFKQVGDLSKVFEIDVAVPTVTAAWITAQVVKAKKLDLRVDVRFEAETDTLKFRIPYVFEKKNIMIGREEPIPPNQQTETERRSGRPGGSSRGPAAARATR